MESKVSSFIQKYNLLKDKELVLVGLSGGADSVSLLILLKRLGYSVLAAHCNFHLRGDESNRDELFVSNLCQKLQIPLEKVDFDTEAYALEHRLSIEMAARELRYTFFRSLMKSRKIAKIAVAHHQDDQAETLIINLLRGAGLHGMRGMLPQNADVIRPLLCVTRQEILQYLDNLKQDYVTDSTNLQPDYLRNKIRLELIPLLKTLNPSVVNNLNTTASNLRDAEEVYMGALADTYSEIIKEKDCVLGTTPITLKIYDAAMESAKMKCAYHEILSAYGFHPAQIQTIMGFSASESGKMVSNLTWQVVSNRNLLEIRPISSSDFKVVTINKTDAYVHLSNQELEIKHLVNDASFHLQKSASIAYLDQEKVIYPLTVRRVNIGDKFVPFGMKGKKLVSDFLTDLKLSIWEKQEQLVLCNATGEIIWVIGRRISNTCAITSNTQQIIQISVKGEF